MIDIEKFLNSLQEEGVEFITGVPDTLLNDFCLYVEQKWPQEHHIITANEGNAVALAAGYYLATGSIPLVYLQNSGLGNTINPFLSLADKNVYGIPMILLIGWRGDPAIEDHVQHNKQGALTPVLLDDLDIPYKILEHNNDDVSHKVKWALKSAKDTNSAVALIVKKGILANGKKECFTNNRTLLMSREEAIKQIIETVPGNAVYVASTGRTARELHELRNIRGEGHEKDFLNVGAMGHTSSIAQGLAIGLNNRLVVCLEGDSSVIMHLGALTTTGVIKPDNFLHVVLNNGVHESVGGQSSAGFFVDLTSIAENCGYNTTGGFVTSEKELQNAISILLKKKGPYFIEVRIRKGMRSDMPKLNINFIDSKKVFMKNLSNIIGSFKFLLTKSAF